MAEENINPPEEAPDNQPTSQTSPNAGEFEALSAKNAELEQSAIQLKDQLLRKAADFDNYKRRMENDYASIIKYSNEELITKLLPILDDFERSIKASRQVDAKHPKHPTSETEESIIRGIELIYSKLKKMLELQGVKELSVVGKPFDSAYHDALLQIPRTDVPPHTVVEEVEKGYTMHDKVIRHARVIVSADESMIEGTHGSAADPKHTPNDSDES